MNDRTPTCSAAAMPDELSPAGLALAADAGDEQRQREAEYLAECERMAKCCDHCGQQTSGLHFAGVHVQACDGCFIDQVNSTLRQFGLRVADLAGSTVAFAAR